MSIHWILRCDGSDISYIAGTREGRETWRSADTIEGINTLKYKTRGEAEFALMYLKDNDENRFKYYVKDVAGE